MKPFLIFFTFTLVFSHISGQTIEEVQAFQKKGPTDMYITGNNVNVRTAPNLNSSEILYQLNWGDKARLVRENDQWFRGGDCLYYGLPFFFIHADYVASLAEFVDRADHEKITNNASLLRRIELALKKENRPLAEELSFQLIDSCRKRRSGPTWDFLGIAIILSPLDSTKVDYFNRVAEVFDPIRGAKTIRAWGNFELARHFATYGNWEKAIDHSIRSLLSFPEQGCIKEFLYPPNYVHCDGEPECILTLKEVKELLYALATILGPSKTREWIETRMKPLKDHENPKINQFPMEFRKMLQLRR